MRDNDSQVQLKELTSQRQKSAWGTSLLAFFLFDGLAIVIVMAVRQGHAGQVGLDGLTICAEHLAGLRNLELLIAPAMGLVVACVAGARVYSDLFIQTVGEAHYMGKVDWKWSLGLPLLVAGIIFLALYNMAFEASIAGNALVC